MAKRKAARSTPERSPWAAGGLAPQDLETAKREALLQLRIGRWSHLATVLVSAVLAVDAVLLLFVFPTLPSLTSGTTGPVAVERSFYLLLVIACGLGISGVGLAAKWEDFQFWPWERHFGASVGALGFNIVVAALYATRVAGAGPLGHVAIFPAFVPLSLAGISVGLLGVVASWTPWGGRQWTSALTAVAPIATSLLLYAPPSIVSNTTSEALAVALLVSAILYQTSGSFLHLVSSGTAPQEAAVVLTGQNRIVRLATELRQRDEAIRFREAALVKREADAEAAETALKRGGDAQAEHQSRLDELEAGHQARSATLADRERELAGRAAAIDAQARAVLERAKELDVRTQELARQAPELAAREQRLAQREGEVAGRDLGIQQRAAELDRREAGVRDGEARFTARRKEIDQKTAELLRREGEVTAREKSSGGSRASPTAVTSSPDLASREVKVQQLKILLDEQNVQLGRRAKEVADQARVVEGALRKHAEREAHLVAREAALAHQEQDLQDRLKAADQRRLQFETASRDYQQRLEEIGQQQVAAAKKGADLDRNLQGISDRERSIAAREAALKAGHEELNRREREVVLRERSLDADEAEVSLRRQEIGREGDLPFAGLLAVAAADRAGGEGTSPAGRTARGRRPRPILGAQDTATSDAGTLAPQTGRKYPDRLPTGTPRLDDLLLGGLPPKSHTALVGPAFVGKEIALYAFIAEGLKRSEPVVLVTASRTATEISESLGVVLPQFREYEQMGHIVTWIDAAGGGAPAGPGRFVPKGSDDHAGILSALVQASKRAEEASKGSGFRVGFFGLSAVLAHADERAGFSFLQNVVGILKPRNALAMYALEAGALTEAQVESLLGRMDGAIVFRQERDRTFLAVKGFGDVATRDWVEVRATGRNLIVGSFALERIR
jgi:KaiC/GvpD/RAD55 family RecA-like ATPase/uncharacterized protein (DUF3084 family)